MSFEKFDSKEVIRVGDLPARFTFMVNDGQLITIHHDGSIERGHAFTTTDAAALEFWDAVEKVRRPLKPWS